ncbi:MAG: alpha/beta hydrolase [Ramlibacter sp.]
MTTWILLRGLTREAGHWGDFGERLAARLAPEDEVVPLELPGNGLLNKQPSPDSVDGMVAACRAELRWRRMQPPYVLVAMSLGAMVGLHWAHEAPDELAGCALINTSVRGISPFWQRLQPHNYPRLLALLLPGLSAARREAMILAMTSSQPHGHAEVPAQWARLRRQHPVGARNALRQLLAAARYAPPRQAPAVPLLVLASEGDRLVSAQCSRSLAARWNLPLRVHPGAGHDLPLDDPQWVLQQLAQWRSATGG